MSQEDIKAEISRQALLVCKQRIKSNVKVALPGILESIRIQLEWCIDFFEGRRPSERNKLHEITVGHFAVRELDERDKEFIEALTRVQYVATQTARGLKLDMAILENDS